MKRTAVCLALLFVLLAAVVAPAAEEEPIDLGKISPADLAPVDVRETVARAHAAYGEGRYEDAAREFVRALRANPGDANSLYNLACCYGLLGMEGQAAAFLEASHGAGFDDVAHMKRDPDFERVRESEGFQAAMERIEQREAARARAAGERRFVRAEYLAEYRVVEPEGEREPWERLPLVVGLHGLGDTAENFAGLFAKRDIATPFLYVAIETPYPLPSSFDRVGFSWEVRSDSVGANGLSVELAGKLVLDVIKAVKREYRVDQRKVFLLGFSQGAAMAFRIGLEHPELFAGVVPVGGWMDPGGHAPGTLRRAAKRGLFLVCHSPGDRVVPYGAGEQAVAELESHGVPHRHVTYEGGHSLPKALMEEITAWIADPQPAEVEGDAK